MSDRPGRFVRALTAGGRARVIAIVVDGPADEVRRRHGLNPTAARLAAEGVVSGLLLSAHIKGDERMMVQVQGASPRFAFTVEVGAEGGLRARMRPSHIPSFERLEGHLLAIKSDGSNELYRGVAAIEDDSFQGALQSYMVNSQQTDGVVRIEATLNDEGEVSSAHGLLVESLPGDDEDGEVRGLLDRLRVADLQDLMVGVAFGQLEGEALEVLELRDLDFRCGCSREKVLGTLVAMGEDEIRGIADELGEAEVICHFCNERYVVEAPELLALADSLRAEA